MIDANKKRNLERPRLSFDFLEVQHLSGKEPLIFEKRITKINSNYNNKNNKMRGSSVLEKSIRFRSRKKRNRKLCFLFSTRRKSKNILSFFLLWIFLLNPITNSLIQLSFPRQALFISGILFARACHPGSTSNGATRVHLAGKLVPFQNGEYVPRVSEQTIGASGPARLLNELENEEDLTHNFNPDIIFSDEIRTYENRQLSHVSQ